MNRPVPIMNVLRYAALCLAAITLLGGCRAEAPPELPREALETIALIRSGGPYPYRKDGSVFHNRERRLPERPRGYYREYTVPTPGERTRGARRIVAGGQPPEVFYYTADHYRSFTRVEKTR